MMTRRIVVWLAAVALALTVATPPTYATDDGPLTGNKSSRALGGPYECYVDGNPFPQYSPSSMTLHWGGKLVCAYVATVWMKFQLQEKVDGLWEVVDSFEKNVVAQYWGSPQHVVACTSTTNHYWRLVAWCTINGVTCLPNPGYSSSYYLPCE